MKRRLDQLLANLGYGTRKEAREYIESGHVYVDEKVNRDVGFKVEPGQVTFKGEPLDHPEGLLLLLNKPSGIVCSHEKREGPSIYDLLPERWRARNPAITSIGRLDKETTGLILLTDQSELVHRLTSPKHKVDKVYVATVDRELSPNIIELFASGNLQLEGEDRPCLPASLTLLSPKCAQVSLIEGKYHQVRRMFAATGSTVLTLQRIRFGPLTLEGTPEGQWKELPLNLFAQP